MTTANGTNGIMTYVQNTNAKQTQEAFAVRTKSRWRCGRNLQLIVMRDTIMVVTNRWKDTTKKRHVSADVRGVFVLTNCHYGNVMGWGGVIICPAFIQ